MHSQLPVHSFSFFRSCRHSFPSFIAADPMSVARILASLNDTFAMTMTSFNRLGRSPVMSCGIVAMTPLVTHSASFYNLPVWIERWDSVIPSRHSGDTRTNRRHSRLLHLVRERQEKKTSLTRHPPRQSISVRYWHPLTRWRLSFPLPSIYIVTNISLGPRRQRDTTLNPLITQKQKQKNMDANLLPTCICKRQNLKDFLRYFERIRLQCQLGDSCFHPAVWVLQVSFNDLPLTVNGRLQFGEIQSTWA